MAPQIDQTNWKYSKDDQGRVYKNCKFNDPRGRGSCAGAFPYSANAIFLFLLSTLGHGLDQLGTYMYDHGRVGQNCKSHDPGAKDLKDDQGSASRDIF